MRISDARFIGTAALLVLGACGSGGAGKADPEQAAQAPADLIECALRGAADFARECTVERERQGGVLVVRHPDGGFRRFEILPDQRGLAPADGAQPAATEWREGGIGLAIGADRYRFPAAVLGDAAE